MDNLNSSKNNRRHFFKVAVGMLALTPLMRVADIFAATAMPKSEKIKKKMIDPKTIKRLHYVAKAEEAKDHKKYKAGDHCATCKFYKADKKEPEWGKCTMAANRYVSSAGWCKSFRAAKK